MHKEFPNSCEIYNNSIDIYFRSPITDELLERLKKRAIEWKLSAEAVLLEEFENICNSMQMKKILKYGENEYSLNSFDSHCVVYADIEGVFFSPPVEFGKYTHNGFTYPKLILKDGYLRNQSNEKEFPLTDSLIDKLGHGYERFFNYEFIGFERL